MAAGGRLAVEVEGLDPFSERVVLELDTQPPSCSSLTHASMSKGGKKDF
jgi:hypothetical protein